MDGERVSAAIGVPFDDGLFRRAEAEAVAAVRRLVVDKPESRDAERLPLYFGTLLSALGVASDEQRRRAAGRLADEHRRTNLWSRRADGAFEILEMLRGRGYRLAVVSNADGRVRSLLEGAGLTPLLEFVVDSAEVGVEKPDPRIFHTATGRLGLPPDACAYVGDIYEIDVLGAEGAGLEAVLVGESPAPPTVRRAVRLRDLEPLFPGFA
jgi:HAD superfamily hydrolase (TIGR01509 family)